MCYFNKQHKVLPTEVIAADKLIKSDKKLDFDKNLHEPLYPISAKFDWVGQGPSAMVLWSSHRLRAQEVHSLNPAVAIFFYLLK